jgi:hypothetical protein
MVSELVELDDSKKSQDVGGSIRILTVSGPYRLDRETPAPFGADGACFGLNGY